MTTNLADARLDIEPAARKWVTATLVLTLLLMMTVGVEAHQIVRHIIQLIPAAAALVVVRQRKTWGLYAALGVHAVWLFLMTLIWLLVLGIAQILVQGTFTPIEVVITVLMGIVSVTGIVVALRAPSRATPMQRAGAFIAFAILQMVCVGISLQHFIPRF